MISTMWRRNRARCCSAIGFIDLPSRPNGTARSRSNGGGRNWTLAPQAPRSAGASSHRGFDLGNVTVIGAQWGDEGKGKIVDWLASRADMVVRFQGGHNAGHTLVVGGETYKLSLLPSGIVRGTPSVIGNGVVLDPWALKAEIERIAAQGVAITPDVLMIAETCPLILPIHRDLDALREDAQRRGQDRHDPPRHRPGL